MSEPVVELRDVFCVHRTNQGDAAALAGMNLALGEREVLCVLGPSGAGKSTLLRVIAGIQPPSAGIVHVLGCDMGRMATRSRSRLRHEQLGVLSQHAETQLPPDMPVRDAVALPLALRAVSRRTRRRRVDELLDGAQLADRADALPGELSGGERQRFALCAALAHRPALLLADEPTGELDEGSAGKVRELISQLASDNGTSVIVASHDPGSAEIADRTVRIRDGRVVEDRRDGETALVIGRGGWVRLPAQLLEGAGIRQRARVLASPGGVTITPAAIDPETTQRRAPAPAAHERWPPAHVEIRSVTRSFGRTRARRTVIAGLTHSFPPGRLTVVTGPSGTGKTTLLRILAGLDRPDVGRLLFDGHPMENQSAEELAALRRRRIGYLPQEPSPVGFLSAVENVILSLLVRGCEPRAAVRHAALVLEQVGLADRARQRVHRLSAGEAQRVALARALASARGLLIVDEPTSRLDETMAAAVATLLATSAVENGQTVICASHDPEVIGRAGDVITLG